MTKKQMGPQQAAGHFSRRSFLKGGAALTAGAALGNRLSPVAASGNTPNFLFIVCDQLRYDAIVAHGAADVRTPNLDRLIGNGTSFALSYSTNPVCSPARSSLFTGRMPVETGVITNGRPIHPSIPHLGQWLGDRGYESVYCGKWHLPYGYPHHIDGFTMLPVGGGQGDILDPMVSHSCGAWLRSRVTDKPFFLTVSYMQPHDICYWAQRSDYLVPEDGFDASVYPQLPQLPPNLRTHPKAPANVRGHANLPGMSDNQWRYYNWIYNRQVEMLDEDIGRLLDALEDSGEAQNTVIVFTSDHGEGGGRHEKVGKWTPYEESARVPLVVSWPGHVKSGERDEQHLVSGLDIVPTLCDFAGVSPPEGVHGRSLRPLLEGQDAPWRDYLVYELLITGRAVHSGDFKYVEYEGDPVRQLFDLRNDPWETENLYEQKAYSDVLAQHQDMLVRWQESMTPCEPMSEMGYWQPERS